jgi:RNA polymerase sigma-70 factor, ECF subfamily
MRDAPSHAELRVEDPTVAVSASFRTEPIPGQGSAERLSPRVRAAQAGDGAAIDDLVATLAPAILRAVRALVGPGSADLEDLSQEVLIAVVDALPSFRGESTLLHFAIRIAARKATAAKRRSRSVLGWLEHFQRRETPLATTPSTPREETVAERRRLLLRELLSKLPEVQAETMVLRVAFGYSIEEVADITRTPINTVRSRLRLAKEALRRRIEQDSRWAELGEVKA